MSIDSLPDGCPSLVLAVPRVPWPLILFQEPYSIKSPENCPRVLIHCRTKLSQFGAFVPVQNHGSPFQQGSRQTEASPLGALEIQAVRDEHRGDVSPKKRWGLWLRYPTSSRSCENQTLLIADDLSICGPKSQYPFRPRSAKISTILKMKSNIIFGCVTRCVTFRIRLEFSQ